MTAPVEPLAPGRGVQPYVLHRPPAHADWIAPRRGVYVPPVRRRWLHWSVFAAAVVGVALVAFLAHGAALSL